MSELLGPLEDQIIILLQSFSSSFLDLLVRLITFFGDTLFFVGIIGLLFFCIDKRLAICLAFLGTITGFITIATKGFFGLERPYVLNNEINGIPDIIGQLPDDYSFPSGHSSSAGSFLTFTSLRFRNPAFWAIAVLMIVFIPLSRSYLGVHWPSDIVMGVILGISFGLLLNYFLPRIEEFITRTSSRALVTISIIISVLSLVSSYALTLGMGNNIDQADPSSLAGLLVGLTVGSILEHRYVGLKVKEFRSKKKILVYRAILGLIIILIIFLSTSAIAGLLFNEFPLYQVARFSRYVILAFAGIFCLPWLFSFIEQKLSIKPESSSR